MRFRTGIGCLLALSLSLAAGVRPSPRTSTISGSPLPDQPYTLIYPDVMVDQRRASAAR